MTFIEKMYSLIILCAVILGLALGNVALVQQYADRFVVPILMGMLYLAFLHIPIEKIGAAFRHLKFTLATLIMNFVWTPLLAWGLAIVFLGNHPALWMGFIMLMVTPCTDWYIVFTGIAKGNVARSITVLPINVILQVILNP